MLNISALITGLAFIQSIVSIRNLASCRLAPIELFSARPPWAALGLEIQCDRYLHILYILYILYNIDATTYNNHIPT